LTSHYFEIAYFLSSAKEYSITLYTWNNKIGILYWESIVQH